MNAYKDMLDNVVSPITCVSMNHQNQLEQLAKGALYATPGASVVVVFSVEVVHDRVFSVD
jgi:hypothetical protein